MVPTIQIRLSSPSQLLAWACTLRTKPLHMLQPRITRWRQNFPIMVVSSCYVLSGSQATNGEQGHFPALSVTSLLASRQCEGRSSLIQRQTEQEPDLRPCCGEPAGCTGSRSMWDENWDLQRRQIFRIGRTGILFEATKGNDNCQRLKSQNKGIRVVD